MTIVHLFRSDSEKKIKIQSATVIEFPRARNGNDDRNDFSIEIPNDLWAIVIRVEPRLSFHRFNPSCTPRCNHSHVLIWTEYTKRKEKKNLKKKNVHTRQTRAQCIPYVVLLRCDSCTIFPLLLVRQREEANINKHEKARSNKNRWERTNFISRALLESDLSFK